VRAKDVVYAGILITALFVLVAHNGTSPMLGRLDVSLFLAINKDMQNPVLNSIGAIAYNNGSDFIIILIVLLLSLIMLVLSIVRNDKELKKLAMILFIALIISVAIVVPLKSIFGIMRPFIYLSNVHVYDRGWFNSDEISFMHEDIRDSFPSGHAALTFTVLGVLWIYKRLRIPFLAFLFLIMFLIVYVGQHYISDILAGGIIGFMIGYLVHKTVTSAVS
jgi:undecaprenyl-diphosphatase